MERGSIFLGGYGAGTYLEICSYKYKSFFKSILLVFLLILETEFTSAQALDQIGKEKNPFKISGGLSASQIVYTQLGLDANRRTPYNYFLSGNLNVSIWGFSIPISFTYSNQRTQFQQPFNQFSLTPTYKWAKFYAGYSAMTFSPYTLNGHIFLGGGVQLTPPGLFRCSAMFGRLNQAVEEDTSNSAVIPYYLRWGGGLKVGIGKGGDGADVTFFMAKDDANSLSRSIIKKPSPSYGKCSNGIFIHQSFYLINLMFQGNMRLLL